MPTSELKSITFLVHLAEPIDLVNLFQHLLRDDRIPEIKYSKSQKTLTLGLGYKTNFQKFKLSPQCLQIHGVKSTEQCQAQINLLESYTGCLNVESIQVCQIQFEHRMNCYLNLDEVSRHFNTPRSPPPYWDHLVVKIEDSIFSIYPDGTINQVGSNQLNAKLCYTQFLNKLAEIYPKLRDSGEFLVA